MKKLTLSFVLTLGLLILAGCNSSDTRAYPATSPEGLVWVDHSRSRVNAIYIREGIDLGAYDSVDIMEPQIALKSDWQERTNLMRPQDPVTDADVEKMISVGKEWLTESFTRELKTGGYALVSESGPTVLGLKANISELEVYSPNPNNTTNPYAQTYTRGAGDATLILELYDTMSGQILARIIDRKSGFDNPNYSRSVYTQEDNINATQATFDYWARIFVEGLASVKANKILLAPSTGEQ